MSSVLKGLPSIPGRVASYELVCNDLWKALKSCTIEELKALKPTPKYVPLIDSLIEVRKMMEDTKDFQPAERVTKNPFVDLGRR